MGRADFWALGDYNAVCSMCGRKRKASQLVKNWQGQYRCPEHDDVRHPQDFVRAVPDVQTPPWTQPPIDTFQGAIACGDAAGTANALVLTPTVTAAGPYPGQIFQFTATVTNTGPATVAVVGSTVTIQKDGAALVAGDIVDGTVYQIQYDDTNFQLDSW